MIRTTFVLATVLVAAATVTHAQIDFSAFHTPAEVDTILDGLVASHPGLARLSTIGTSHEGRPIKVLKISDNVTTDEPDEDDVVFVALHHAREWISVEMALYLAEQLLVRYGTDPQVAADVDGLEIWIIPVLNPDGYAYTRSVDRFWRKNRRDNGDGTFGVDLNRNWGFQWGLASGSSGSTSDDTYRGPFAFSEPEVVALRDFVLGLDNLEVMVSYHSYSELFLRPWGYTTDDASGEETLRQLALRSIGRIATVHGHTYIETIWYTAAGEATDWFWGDHRISGFTPELRPASGSLGGFAPPPSEIVPNNEENLPAALGLIHDAGSKEMWMRDYAGDSGAEPSAVWTGSGWSHAFWVSPNITTVPESLDQGATVELRVQIENATGATQSDVRVDVYFTDPRISLEFPNPDATLIGSQTVTVPPSGTVVSMPWTVPVGTNSWGERHWCVGAIVMHEDDLPLTTEAQRSSNVAIRNFNTTEVIAANTLMVAATNFLAADAELRVMVDRKQLPRGWEAHLPPPPKRRLSDRLGRKARLLRAKGRLLSPGETVYLPVRVVPPPGAPRGTRVDVAIHAALTPLVAGPRSTVGSGFTYRVVLGIPGKH